MLLTQQQISELRQQIDGAQNIIITCHHNPDGDALGSSLALARFLRQLGKDATVIIPDAYPDFLQWLPDTQEMVRYDKHPDKASMLLRIADLIFCLDYNTLSRVGEQMEQALREASAPKVLIDHHLSPDIPAVLVISHPEMCSTSQMVFHVIDDLGHYADLDRQQATQIYCGMMTDTGAFTYNSTQPSIYLVISQLLAKGINKDKIYRNVFWTYSEDRMRLMGHVLTHFHYLKEHHAAYYTISRADMRRFHFIKGDAEGLVNLPLQIAGTRLSISLREDTEKPNLVWVSLRSVDDYPCNLLAQRFFNGGGHLNAAGGRLYCSLAEAEQIAIRAITEGPGEA